MRGQESHDACLLSPSMDASPGARKPGSRAAPLPESNRVPDDSGNPYHSDLAGLSSCISLVIIAL